MSSGAGVVAGLPWWLGSVSCVGVPAGSTLDLLRLQMYPEASVDGVISDARGSRSSRSGLGTASGANTESGRFDEARRTVAAASLYVGNWILLGRFRRWGSDSSSNILCLVGDPTTDVSSDALGGSTEPACEKSSNDLFVRTVVGAEFGKATFSLADRVQGIFVSKSGGFGIRLGSKRPLQYATAKSSQVVTPPFAVSMLSSCV